MMTTRTVTNVLALALVAMATIPGLCNAQNVSTSFSNTGLQTSEAVDGFTLTYAGGANLVTDGSINIVNSDFTGAVNDGNALSLDRVRFNPSGNTATWNITDAAASGVKLYFVVADVDNGSFEESVISDGTDPIAFSSLLGGYEFNNNTTYTTVQMDGFYDQGTGTLSSMNGGNTSPIAVWEVSGLSTVTWTPNNNAQQAGFFTMVGPAPATPGTLIYGK